MNDTGFWLFDTAIGRCALCWRGERLVGVSLPEANDAAMRARLSRKHSGAREAPPPEFVREAMAKIVALAGGARIDLADIPLDRSGIEPFANSVYEIALTIRPGETLTYGAIAERLGDKALSRAVGAALGANPFPIIIPCHRIVASDGKFGGFSAHGGAETKRRLLEIEGAFAPETLPLFGGA